ncbi:unnamed protein product [Calypogeia fissa]
MLFPLTVPYIHAFMLSILRGIRQNIPAEASNLGQHSTPFYTTLPLTNWDDSVVINDFFVFLQRTQECPRKHLIRKMSCSRRD